MTHNPIIVAIDTPDIQRAKLLIASKSKNSPFDKWKTKGRALRTVVGGECVFRLA